MHLPTLRTLAASVVLLTLPVAAQAQFTVYTDLASFLAATSNAGTDTFESLSITTTTPSPMARTAGTFGYTASVNTTTFFGAGTAADHWLSTNTATDIVTFNGFGSGIRGVGGFFFGSSSTGAFRPATSLILTATSAAGATTRTLLDTTLGTFLGFVSGTDIFSLTLESVQPATGFAWPTVNDFVLAQAPAANVVPEPASIVLLATGVIGLLVLLTRRRT